jgi:ornithine cyclodeaminase
VSERLRRFWIHEIASCGRGSEVGDTEKQLLTEPRPQGAIRDSRMHVLNLDEIRGRIDDGAVILRMREALIAQARGECSTPMPMHLDTANGGEVHMKSSYRRGGKYFALKMASTFQGAGNGMMLLSSAETGEPVAYLADQGHLTDVRTAAVAAMVARELGRRDTSMGILGTGIQARLTARFHRHVLPIENIFLWGRDREKAERCASEIGATVVQSPAMLAASTRFIVTCTAARAPLLFAGDLQPGTHISAVGADSVGKQELDPSILRQADLVLVDSRRQCQKLGELQHAADVRSVEIGSFCESPRTAESSVADFTGLGVEDLFIAEMIYEG